MKARSIFGKNTMTKFLPAKAGTLSGGKRLCCMSFALYTSQAAARREALARFFWWRNHDTDDLCILKIGV